MKHLFFTLSAFIFLAAACTNAKKSDGNAASETQTQPSPHAADYNANAAVANELFEKLMTKFSPDWMEREGDPSIYPSFYAGSFISDQGKFVIAVTANTEQNRKTLADMLGTDDFIVQTERYSYADLLRVMNSIDVFLSDSSIAEDHPVLVNFAGAYPDVVDNCVRVTLLEVNERITSAFKRDISNSPTVVFEKGDRPVLY